MAAVSRPELISIEQHTGKGKVLLQEALLRKDNKKFTEAIEEYQLALNHAFLFNKEIIPCLVNLGAAHVNAGKYQEGLIILDSLLEDQHHCKEVLTNGVLHGHTLYYQGVAHAKSGAQKKAISFFEKAIREYRKESASRPYLCDTLIEMGELYSKLGDHQQSYSLLEEAAERLFTECGNVERSCDILLRQVGIALSSKATFGEEKIKSVLENCLTQSSQIVDLPKRWEIILKVGTKYAVSNQEDEALRCYHTVLNCMAKAENASVEDSTKVRRLKATLLQYLAKMYAHKKEFEKSGELSTSAADIFGKLGHRNAQAKCFFLFALNQREQRQFGKSYQSFLHALQAYKDTDDKVGEWRTYEQMADICMLRSYYGRASQCYQLAYKLQACGDETSEMLIVKLSLALKQDSSPPNALIRHSSLNTLQFAKESKKIEEEEQQQEEEGAATPTSSPQTPLKSSLKLSKRSPSEVLSSTSGSSSASSSPRKVKMSLKKIVEKVNKRWYEEKFEEDEEVDSLADTTSIDLNSSSNDDKSNVTRPRSRPSKVGRRVHVPMRYANRGLSSHTLYSDHLATVTSEDDTDDDDDTDEEESNPRSSARVPFVSSESDEGDDEDEAEPARESRKKKKKTNGDKTDLEEEDRERRSTKGEAPPLRKNWTETQTEVLRSTSLPLTDVSDFDEEESVGYQLSTSSASSSSSGSSTPFNDSDQSTPPPPPPPPVPPRVEDSKTNNENPPRPEKRRSRKIKKKKSKACIIM